MFRAANPDYNLNPKGGVSDIIKKSGDVSCVSHPTNFSENPKNPSNFEERTRDGSLESDTYDNLNTGNLKIMF